MPTKLVLITRSDLSPGYQSVQPAHALAQFSQTYPSSFKEWYDREQNLIVLATTNEKQLLKLARLFSKASLDHVVFREPDIGNHVTAVAVGPSEAACKLTSNLPLALRDHPPTKMKRCWFG